MLAILSLASAYAAWRIGRVAVTALLAALRDVPRSNDDMVFF